MGSEWSIISLGDCGTWYSGGTPDTTNARYWDGDIPWISASSLHDFYIRDSDRRVTELGIQNGTRLVPAQTILFVVRGMSLKTEFRVGITQRPVAFGQDCKAIIVRDEIDPLFLANALRARAPDILGLTDEASHGTGRLQTETLRQLEIDLPPLPEQRAIAAILGALDDKIELNRRMNGTLEATARALFKAWFVDFEPVRARMEGRPSGLPGEIEALFPEELEEGEGGVRPWGWGVGPLEEVIDVNPPRALKKGRLAPYLDMANMPTDSALAFDPTLREFGSGMRFMNGDTLVARITPCLENGKTCFVQFLDDDEIGWGSTEYIVLRSKSPLPAVYSYFVARDSRFREHAIANMTGTSGRQRVPADSIRRFPLVVPPEDIAKAFGKIADQIMQSMSANSIQSRTLAALRDELLPRLMRGEVRVSNLENLFEVV